MVCSRPNGRTSGKRHPTGISEVGPGAGWFMTEDLTLGRVRYGCRVLGGPAGYRGRCSPLDVCLPIPYRAAFLSGALRHPIRPGYGFGRDSSFNTAAFKLRVSSAGRPWLDSPRSLDTTRRVSAPLPGCGFACAILAQALDPLWRLAHPIDRIRRETVYTVNQVEIERYRNILKQAIRKT